MARRTVASHSEEWWALIAGPTAVRCEGHYKTGERCRREAILGSTVCRIHGGAAPQIRQKAAARIGNAADEMVKRLFAMLDDPETPHAVRSKIMQDMLDRAGLNATEKHEVKVDSIELLFQNLLSDPANFAEPVPVVLSAETLSWNRAVLESNDEDVVEAELVEEPEPAPTIDLGVVSSQPPAHIRRDLKRLGLL